MILAGFLRSLITKNALIQLPENHANRGVRLLQVFLKGFIGWVMFACCVIKLRDDVWLAKVNFLLVNRWVKQLHNILLLIVIMLVTKLAINVDRALLGDNFQQLLLA